MAPRWKPLASGVVLLGLWFAPSLSAQHRATLQVAATVVDNRPSLLALEAARQLIVTRPKPHPPTLAVIRIDRPHRTREVVITIDFVRN